MKSSHSGKSDLDSPALSLCAEELVLMSLVEMLNLSHGEIKPDDFGVDVELPNVELELEHRLIGLLQSRLAVRSMIGEEGSDRTHKCLVDASVMETKPLVRGDILNFFSGWSDGAGWRLIGEMYLVMGDWVRSIVLCCFEGLLWSFWKVLSLFTVGVFGCSSFVLWGSASGFSTLRMSDNFRLISLRLECELDILGCSLLK